MLNNDANRMKMRSYYAPVPIFCFALDGSLTDLNIAAQLLISSMEGTDHPLRLEQAIDYNGLNLESEAFAPLVAILNPPLKQKQSTHARFFVSGDLCRLSSRHYGEVKLIPTALGSTDFETGKLQGITLYWDLNWETDNSAGRKAFMADFAERVEHQLTWDSYAVSYDRILLRMDYYNEVLDRHIRALSSNRTGTILDLGAGTGNVSAPLVKAGHRVTAVDLNRSMLDRLPAKLNSEEQRKLCSYQQNGEHLGNESFDGVNVLLVLFDMTNPVQGLEEAARVLKPGGVLAITEPKSCFNVQAVLGKVEESLKQQKLFDELYDDWQRVFHANLSINPKARSDRLWIEDITHILQQRGFHTTGPQDSHFGNCATVIATKPK